MGDEFEGDADIADMNPMGKGDESEDIDEDVDFAGGNLNFGGGVEQTEEEMERQ